MSPVKAIFFDLDDTLFDHRHSCRMGLAALQTHFSRLNEQEMPLLEETYQAYLNANYNQVLTGQSTIEDSRRDRMRRFLHHFGCETAEPAMTTAVTLYRRAYERYLQTVPGAETLLAALHGRYRLGLISNGLVFYQFKKIGRLHLKHYFDHFFISEAVGLQKPDSRIFEAASQQFKVSPETAVMVGDSWNSDILGSTQAGLTAVWFNRFQETKPEAPAAYEINQLSALEAIIGR